MKEWTKSRFEVIMTSDGLNKNLDGEIKNQYRTQITAPAITLRLLTTQKLIRYTQLRKAKSHSYQVKNNLNN